jgi:hypothetical protein
MGTPRAAGPHRAASPTVTISHDPTIPRSHDPRSIPRACGPHGAASPTVTISHDPTIPRCKEYSAGAQSRPAQSSPAGAAGLVGTASLVASPTVTISPRTKEYSAARSAARRGLAHGYDLPTNQGVFRGAARRTARRRLCFNLPRTPLDLPRRPPRRSPRGPQ